MPGLDDDDDEFISTDAIKNIYTKVYEANQTLMGLENVENHLMMLNHYQQTKNLLVSYSPKKLGFF